MKEITIRAYTFEELSKDVQDKIVEEFREEYDYNDELEEYLRDRLSDLTGLEFELEYSLNYMQGDGLRFTGRMEGEEIKHLPFAKLVKDAENTIINIIPDGRGYRTYIDIDADTCYDSQDYYDDEWDKLQEAVDEWYNTIAKTLEEEGYNYIEDMESEENIREILISMDADYTEDGTMI